MKCVLFTFVVVILFCFGLCMTDYTSARLFESN
jgi:hypothetical protein